MLFRSVASQTKFLGTTLPSRDYASIPASLGSSHPYFFLFSLFSVNLDFFGIAQDFRLATALTTPILPTARTIIANTVVRAAARTITLPGPLQERYKAPNKRSCRKHIQEHQYNSPHTPAHLCTNSCPSMSQNF